MLLLARVYVIYFINPSKKAKFQYYSVIPFTASMHKESFSIISIVLVNLYVEGSLSPLFAFPEDKLQSVEKQYLKDLQKENQKWSSQTEKHLLKLHKQWEQKKKKFLNEEVKNKRQ